MTLSKPHQRRNDMTIKIEKNVAIPKINVGGGNQRKYPWYEMEVGDSFFVPGENG
jgi:hypothetical protein